MATAKERNQEAVTRAMSAYRDYLDNGEKGGLLCEKYGVGHARIYTLIQKGRRLSTPYHHWTYGLLTDEELQDLDHIKDWVEFLADNIDAPKSKKSG